MKSSNKPQMKRRDNAFKSKGAQKAKGAFKARGGDKGHFRSKNPNQNSIAFRSKNPNKNSQGFRGKRPNNNREAFETRKALQAERNIRIRGKAKPRVDSDADSTEPESDEDDEYRGSEDSYVEEDDNSDEGADIKTEPDDEIEDDQDDEIEDDQDDEAEVEPKKEKTKTKAKTKEEKSQRNLQATANTIFVGNLPTNLTHQAIAKLFKCCGPVESARIRSVVPEKEKLSQKVALITKRLHPKVGSVNAYVVFKNNVNDECIKKALKMNGQIIDGHHIRVDRAGMPKAKKETLTSRKKSVFVGNLRFDIRNDELIDHFSKVGSVSYVRLVRDSSTGLGKGFGFVVFDERASVKKALELNETQFKGRSLRVKKVEEEQKPRQKPKPKEKEE